MGMSAGAATALQAAGQVSQGQAQKRAGSYNSAMLDQEARALSNQYGNEEAAMRRRNALQLGNMSAAAAQAGTSTGASTQSLERQSATTAELDALNLRYMGHIRAMGYEAQSKNVAYEGDQQAFNSYLRAGGALLRGSGSGYSVSGYSINS